MQSHMGTVGLEHVKVNLGVIWCHFPPIGQELEGTSRSPGDFLINFEVSVLNNLENDKVKLIGHTSPTN